MRLLEGSSLLPSPALELTYVTCGLGAQPKDFPKQVKGRIALVQRGEVTFVEKARNAQKAGAIGCVIYNNREGNFFGTLGDEQDKPAIPVVSISKADGEVMVASIDAKSGISTVPLRLNPEAVPQPDRLAEFSSRGPNNDGWIKPELIAPGVDINSATIVKAPLPGGGMPDPSGYISTSGTSMATPHIAGAAALVRQVHPDWSALQIKAALVNTARFIQGQGGVMDQGAGAVDLLRAIDCRAILVTAAERFSPTHSFGVVVHKGQQKMVSQALTIQSLSAEPDLAAYELSVHIAGDPEGLKAELSAANVVCDQKTCMASFDLKLAADGVLLADGNYYGWVLAKAEWGTLQLPFYCEARKEARVDPPEPDRTQPPSAERKRPSAVAVS